MKQEQFIQHYQALWQQLEAWLDYQVTTKNERARLNLVEPSLDFPQTYRQICHHLALAQSRLYSPALIERLNQLVIRGHNVLYSSRLHFLHGIAEFYLRTLPQQVRRSYKAVLLAALLFFGSFGGMLAAIQVKPELVYSVVDPSSVAKMESMYEPSRTGRLGREREADSDVLMFGYYIRNNTGIGFQCFASGILYGIGSIFFLLFNGLYIGAIAGHLTQIGYIETFWGFVAGHSAFELTAIVLSGAAGFLLSKALIMPGRKSRGLALRDESRHAILIVYGAMTLFIMAAFIEAFWSSQTWIPLHIKYAVGIGLWFLTIGYFLLVGRNSASNEVHYAA
jgi:uncharacterized membrane protein SpoIIM required for sporulation